MLVLDGLYVERPNGALRFRWVKAPTSTPSLGASVGISSATATLDRLLHHSHVLNIKGRSYRLRDLEQAVSLRQ